MIKFEIAKTADTLVGQASLFNCSLEEAWETYMHPAITQQFTFEEISNYIKDTIILGERYKDIESE